MAVSLAADFHQVSEEVMAAVARDTSKSQSVTQATKELMSIKNCCTRSRRFFCNRRTWAAAEAVMAVIQEEAVMEDLTESRQAMDHLKSHPAMAHLDMARAALLALISVMSFRDTKSLNT